jgi:hypothetical protein
MQEVVSKGVEPLASAPIIDIGTTRLNGSLLAASLEIVEYRILQSIQ